MRREAYLNPPVGQDDSENPMKPLGLILSVVVCTNTYAATSEILVQNTLLQSAFAGSPGNIIFDGRHFVTPSIRTNGEIYLVFMDTNAMFESESALGVTGNEARLAFDGINYFIAWMDTNASPARFLCSQLVDGIPATISVIATNVAPGTFSVRAGGRGFLALWQSAESNSVVWAQWLRPDSEPLSNAFPVSSSTAPQQYPAVNMEGTNYLVCWMERNFASNDWRVVTRFIDENGPRGLASSISQTNSLFPHPTACSFGTNYLVAWSVDYGPYSLCDFGAYDGFPPPCPNDQVLWFSTVHGQMVSAAGEPVGGTRAIIRGSCANTNITVAFGNGQYLIGAGADQAGPPFGYLTPSSPFQALRADGTADHYGIPPILFAPRVPRFAFGAGRFCIVAGDFAARSFSTTFIKREMLEPTVLSISRSPTNGRPYAVQVQRGYSSGYFEVSTNLVDWLMVDPWNFPNSPRLFFRTKTQKWECTENLRAIYWAKQQWAMDNKRPSFASPDYEALFGAGRYLPSLPICPSGGTYTIDEVAMLPVCSLGVLGHTVH